MKYKEDYEKDYTISTYDHDNGGVCKKDFNGYIAVNTGSSNNPSIITIDSCEYIVWGYWLAHKGNCRFCKERREKELAEQLKEK